MRIGNAFDLIFKLLNRCIFFTNALITGSDLNCSFSNTRLPNALFMKNNPYAYLAYFLILLLGAGCSGLNPPPNYNKSVENWRTVKPQDSTQIRHSVFLIGDVGAPSANAQEPSLKYLRKQMEVIDTNSTTIFLGDNVYSYGMP